MRTAGRLGGAEMRPYRELPRRSRAAPHAARRHRVGRGQRAFTTYGTIGVRCWIFKGEVLPQRPPSGAAGPGLLRISHAFPKRTKFRKQWRRVRTAPFGQRVQRRPFGDFAPSVPRAGRIAPASDRAARMAIQRATKRQGKLHIRIFPDKPVTKKPSRLVWVTVRATWKSGWPS